MTDGSNIDDILKSIDALLKEGHEEQRQGNDDVTDDVIGGDAVDAVCDGEETAQTNDATDQVEISILPDAASDDASAESAGEAEDTGDAGEPKAETDESAENNAAGGVQVPTDEQQLQHESQHEPTTQQHVDVPEKRILLSAEMQVQDTPELPLAAVEEDAEPEPLEVSQTATEDVAPAVMDEAQVAQITADVCAELQRQLPEMIAPLVAAALRRHLGAGGGNEPRE